MNKDTWSTKVLLNERTNSLKESQSDSSIEVRTLEQKTLHVTDSQLRYLANYQIHRLHNKVQIFHEKTSGCIGKYTKHMEMLVEGYKFCKKDPIAELWFLAQLRRAWFLWKVIEGTAMWIAQTFIRDGPALSLTNQITSRRDKRIFFWLPNTSKYQISTYEKPVNIILKPYAKDSDVVEAASNIFFSRNTLSEPFG